MNCSRHFAPYNCFFGVVAGFFYELGNIPVCSKEQREHIAAIPIQVPE
jgi:hypothetical protein